jgi:hypothetical protein
MSLAGQPRGQLAAVVRTADRIDNWIRRRVHATDLAYDPLAPPMPPHIAALVEQLETGNRWRATLYVQTMHVQKPHWLDYDPVALAVLVIGIGIIELLALII